MTIQSYDVIDWMMVMTSPQISCLSNTLPSHMILIWTLGSWFALMTGCGAPRSHDHCLLPSLLVSPESQRESWQGWLPITAQPCTLPQPLCACATLVTCTLSPILSYLHWTSPHFTSPVAPLHSVAKPHCPHALPHPAGHSFTCWLAGESPGACNVLSVSPRTWS